MNTGATTEFTIVKSLILITACYGQIKDAKTVDFSSDTADRHIFCCSMYTLYGVYWYEVK